MNQHNVIETSLPFLPNVFQKDRLSLLNWLKNLEEQNVIRFASIANIATDIYKNSTVLIGFLDQEGFYFKQQHALAQDDIKRAEKICQLGMDSQKIVDFVENDETGEVHCLGFPLLTTKGYLIGIFCLINRNAPPLLEREKNALDNLAKITVSLFEQSFLVAKEKKRIAFIEDQTSVEMYVVASEDLKILFVNNNVLKSSGFQHTALFNRKITKILNTKNPYEFEEKLLNLPTSAKKSFSIFAEQTNQDGSKTLVKIFASLIRDNFDSSILIISRNLTNTGFESEFVEYMTNYDLITGLGNRRMFERLIEEKIEDAANLGQNLGLLIFDLENLQLINKSFGYRTGDKLSRQLSQIFLKFADTADFVLRVEQDAFCLLILDCNLEELKYRANKILLHLGNLEFSNKGKKFKVQSNAGGIIVNPNEQKREDYLSLAFKACDVAKEFGQNQFYVAERQDLLLIKKHNEIKQLMDVQDAIHRNKIVLYSQKIQKLSAKAVKYKEHLEILCRMINENNQIVTPDKFIPQLEKHGSIPLLDEWVLKKSLELINEQFQEVKYVESLKGCMYNINLSAKTIGDESFIKTCQELLTKYHHLASCICFEITETVALSNFQTAQNFIEIIHSFGAKLAIDDFGSGGASLECLKELDIDFLKIDGAFVSDVVNNPVSQLIVKSICKLASLLKIQVIAEKVEDELVEKNLKRIGIHYIQGYKVQTPIPLFSA